MNFTPQPPDQLETPSYELLPDGTYKWVVGQATEKKSKSGNEMIELVLEHRDEDGRLHKVWDYLVATEAAVWKTYTFCKAAGLMAEYDEGRLSDRDCQGCIVMATVKFEAGTNGYADKLKVTGYEPPEGSKASTERAIAGQAPASTTGPHQPVDESDIPF